MTEAEVFQRERARLLAVAFRILGADADAQDVVQEAWLRFDRAATDSIANPQAWLTTVVTRLCLDQLRRAREEPAELSIVDDEVSGPEQVVLLAGELTEAVTVLLAALTPAQRVALILHDVFGTPFEEIGPVLGTTAGAAKKLASRATGVGGVVGRTAGVGAGVRGRGRPYHALRRDRRSAPARAAHHYRLSRLNSAH